MSTLIICFCLMFLLLSNACMFIVMIKFTDKVKLHSKLISEILDNLCNVLGKDDDEEEE